MLQMLVDSQLVIGLANIIVEYYRVFNVYNMQINFSPS